MLPAITDHNTSIKKNPIDYVIRSSAKRKSVIYPENCDFCRNNPSHGETIPVTANSSVAVNFDDKQISEKKWRICAGKSKKEVKRMNQNGISNNL